MTLFEHENYMRTALRYTVQVISTSRSWMETVDMKQLCQGRAIAIYLDPVLFSLMLYPKGHLGLFQLAPKLRWVAILITRVP